MPKHGLSLIRNFPYMDRIISVFSRILTESKNLSKYGKIRWRFCPYTWKYGSRKAHFSAFFTKWSPREGVLIFNKVGKWRLVTLLQIYFLNDFYDMCTTTVFYSPYYQQTYLEDWFSTSENNAKQSSNESRFLYGKSSLENILQDLLDIWGLYCKHDGTIKLFWTVLRITVVIKSVQKKEKRDRYI